MDLSIIIVNRNTKELVLKCLASVYSTLKEITCEVFVIDNASSDGSVEAIRKEFPDVIVIQNDRNLGFAAANNIALRRLRAPYAMLLNSDAYLTDGVCKELLSFMESHPEAGMVCGQLLNSDGTLQNSFSAFPSLWNIAFNESLLRIIFPKRFPKKKGIDKPIMVDSCIGACMLVRMKAIETVGFLDEQFFFFFEETDWALRMKKAGWAVYFVPSAKIYHYKGATAGHGVNSRIMYYNSRYLYLKKWHSERFGLFRFILLSRLLLDTLTGAIGVLLTLGLNRSLRERFTRYLGLIQWHIKGCPSPEVK